MVRIGSKSLPSTYMDRMESVAHDFTQKLTAAQKLPVKALQGYTPLLAMRSWEFEALFAFSLLTDLVDVH